MKKGDNDFNWWWWRKDCSIKGLYNEFKKNEKIAKYTSFENDCISLTFHESFKLKIIDKNGYFNTYINNKFEYNIEEQDIYEYIEEIVNDMYVIVEYNKKVGFFHRNYFKFIINENFIISKLKNIDKNVKRIFTIDKILFEKE